MVHDPDYRFRSTMSQGQEPGDDSEAETAGVDVTLIEEMLHLSPAERLQQNDRMASLAAKLRSAFRDGGHAIAEPRDLTTLIEALLDEKVDFVLVGAPAAIAQGAPVTTHDVEIVHARTPENLDRLMTALEKLGARSRGRSVESPLPPDRRKLATTGHSLLMTTLGPLDCLGAIEGGRDYDDLMPLSTEIELTGRRLRILVIETIVALKRQSTELKDRLMLPVLEATLKKRDAGS